MCGIAGILSLNNSKIETSIVDNVKRSLEHRGPDHSSHKYISSSICLIHTRLSIIDLNDRSNQPLQSDDGRFIIEGERNHIDAAATRDILAVTAFLEMLNSHITMR